MIEMFKGEYILKEEEITILKWLCPKQCGGEMKSTNKEWTIEINGYWHTCSVCNYTSGSKQKYPIINS